MLNTNSFSTVVSIGKNLAGHYDLVGQSLRSGKTTLYIKHRKLESITKKKPQKFLILTKPKFEYISSMYPVEPDRYLIEYKDSGYCLTMTGQEAEIEPVSLQEVKEFVNEYQETDSQVTQSEFIKQGLPDVT